jgi:hypothetical protein
MSEPELIVNISVPQEVRVTGIWGDGAAHTFWVKRPETVSASGLHSQLTIGSCVEQALEALRDWKKTHAH